MRLVALVESADHVCCRYRVDAFRPGFDKAGYSLEIIPLPRSWVGCLRLFRTLGTAVAVLLQRTLLPPLLVASLRRHARFLIFDFDDAIWLRDSYSAKGFESGKRLRRFRSIVSMADHVVAGNAYLAEQAAKEAGKTFVSAIPTCVDPSHYSVARHDRPGVTLAWIGSKSTLQGLERLRPTLEAIGQKVPGARLKLICDTPLSFDHLSVDFVPWTAEEEAAELTTADVGIAWVPDDSWSRGKCGLKVIQYHAAGLPVVANPVGVQAEMVRDGRTGYLADSTETWVEAVRKLGADSALRRRLGSVGREQIESKYSLAAGERAWATVLDRIVPKRTSVTG